LILCPCSVAGERRVRCAGFSDLARQNPHRIRIRSALAVVELLFYRTSVHTATFKYATVHELWDALQAAGSSMRLPAPEPLQPGSWVLAVFEFQSSARATAAAARVVGETHDADVLFEQRDWERLIEFSRPASVPLSTPREALATIPDLLPPPDVASVLVVEDDRLATEVVRSFLEDDGWAVVCVEHAEDALPLLDKRTFALFVLDWTLPGKSGLDLCVEIRKRPLHANTPVLFLTANTAASAVEAAFRAGANDYICKPVQAGEFRARVLALLSRSGQHRRSSSPG